jgi:hypothetical protein
MKLKFNPDREYQQHGQVMVSGLQALIKLSV